MTSSPLFAAPDPKAVSATDSPSLPASPAPADGKDVSFANLLGAKPADTTSPKTTDSGRIAINVPTVGDQPPSEAAPDDLSPAASGKVASPAPLTTNSTSARQILIAAGPDEEAPTGQVSALPTAPSKPAKAGTARKNPAAETAPVQPDTAASVPTPPVAVTAAQLAEAVLPAVPLRVATSLLAQGGTGTSEATSTSDGGAPTQGSRAAVVLTNLPGQATVPSASPLLAQDDVRVAPTVAQPPTHEETSAPATAKSSDTERVTPQASSGKSPEAPASVQPAAPRIQSTDAVKNSLETLPLASGEKTAVAISQVGSPRAVASLAPAKDKILNIGNQKVAKREYEVGTEAAKADAMMATRPNASAPEGRTDGAALLRSDAVTTVSASAANAGPHIEKIAATPGSHAAEAVGVIREVVSMTDDMRSRERSSVDMQFHLKDDSRLDVRIAYRDGQVQATFRTDSADLRDTLSREWQVQAGSASGEGRAVRMADPVFSNASSGGAQAGGFSLGGDTSRQPAQQQPQPQYSQTGSGLRAVPSVFFTGNSAQISDASDARLTDSAPAGSARRLNAIA